MSEAPDVSAWQGTISLPTAKDWHAAGWRSAFVKVGGGDDNIYKDDRHDGTVQNLRSAGLIADRYYFNGGDPTTAARHVASWLHGDGAVALSAGEKLYWDVEGNAWSDTQTATAIRELAALGFPTSRQGFYASASMLRSYPTVHTLLPNGLWGAQYGSNSGKPEGSLYTGLWGGFEWWQFTSNGTAPGYNGRIDLSTSDGTSTTVSGGTVIGGNITSRSTKTLQQALIAKGFSCGPTGADGLWGPNTEAAVTAFQKSVGIDDDGIYGPVTDSHLFGVAAVPRPSKTPPRAPVFPLPAGSYFGPRAGSVKSVSGYFSHNADLKKWQTRMRARGWVITPDGYYGPQTAGIAKAFQVEKHLTPDSLIGRVTWAAAWTEPIS